MRDQRGPAQRGTTKRGFVLTKHVENLAKNAGYEVRKTITSIIADPAAAATAKVTAIRTLAEMDGLIGRHQAAPDRAASSALSGLSRDELIGELERLRIAVELGLVR